MNFNNYQEKILTFMNPETMKSQDAVLMNATLGLAGEAGEFVDMVKKYKFHGKSLDIKEAKLELGDSLFYITLAAEALGGTLEELAHMNVDKLSRRYPKGHFTTADSIAKADTSYENN